jgi:beta-galactosidase
LRGDAAGAERPEFDDASWRTVDLPHDWSVEELPAARQESDGSAALWTTEGLPTRVGPFDTLLSAGGRDTGWFVGGTGWYRKRFSAMELPADSLLEILFDGVYMNSDVWLNGAHLGNHPYGYTAFAYDLTPHLRRTGANVLAVRVRNEGRNSRWYSGSGIYRHVWLNATGSVRVPLWGVYVVTPEVSASEAAVRVAVPIENHGAAAADVAVRVRLLDPAGAQAASEQATRAVAGGGTAQAEFTFHLTNPELWSLSTPRLYRVEVELAAGGKVSDRVETPFGIRKIEVDAARGLRINGEPVKLKGGCMHHDNGLLGAAAIDRAEERRIELMKAHGFNAIRTAHNPPSPAFLDACDRLGMLVMDEAFDCWERQKNAQDYHVYFAEWWQRDLDAMVLRDRNHPSVIFWSIGNEIPERYEPRGVEIARQLVDRIRALDPTRPITAGVNGGRPAEGLDPAFQHLDVAGYNYLWGNYEPDHARHPQRVIVGTESFPQHAHHNWRLVEKHPYVIGDFVWTGMDHLGESSIGNAQLVAPARGGMGAGGAGAPARGAAAAPAAAGSPGQAPGGGGLGTVFTGPITLGNINLGFPWFNCYCGDIDLIGEAKPQWYLRKVLWGMSKLEMAVQRPLPAGRNETISAWGWSDELRSWTWPGYEGRTLRVRVYSSGDRVRLLVNGKEIGEKAVGEDTGRMAEFEAPYEAGELKAVALAGGSQIAEQAFKTVGPPARLRLRADRAAIRRTPGDLAYVTIEVLDKAGELVPDAVAPVTLAVTGSCELAAAGSANPKDVLSFRSPHPKTFHGRALAILRPRAGVVGPATLRATAAGLAPATAVIRVS